MPGAGAVDNVVVVYTGPAYPDVQHAATLADAVTAVLGSSTLDTIWLPPGAYSYNFTLERGESVTVTGLGTSSEPPLDVIIQAADANEPVVRLDNLSGKVVFESLTIRGGSHGVQVYNNAGNVVFNRCFITANTQHGVLCEGSTQARPTFVNCSISHNGGDGVRAASPGTAAGAATNGVQILDCSIIDNAGNGVYVANKAAARVRNSLVYGNYTGWTGATPYEYLFNGADTGGFLGDAGSQWAFGVPSGLGGLNGNPDPAAGYTGTNVWGVNLAGDYQINTDGDDQYDSGGPVDDLNDVEFTGAGLPIDVGDEPIETLAVLSVPTQPVPPLNHEMIVGDVNVLLDIDHPCVEKLTVSLVHGGAEALLFSGGGSPAAGGCGAYLRDTLFDDEASVAINAGAAPFSGVFAAVAPLSAFDEAQMTGDWTLRIVDAGGTTVLLDDAFNDPPSARDNWTGGADWQVVEDVTGPAGDGEYRNTVGVTPVSVFNEPGSELWQDYTIESAFRVADSTAASIGAKDLGVVFRYEGPGDYYLFRLRLDTDCASTTGLDTDCLTFGVYRFVVGVETLLQERQIDPADYVGTLEPGEHATIDWARAGFNLTVDAMDATINLTGDAISVQAHTVVPVTVLDSLGNVLPPPFVPFTRDVNVSFSVTDTSHPAGSVGFLAANILGGFDKIRVVGEAAGRLNAWSIQVEPIYYLTMPAMDFSSLSADETLGMTFGRWLNTGADSIATIEYSTDNATWQRLWWNREQSDPEITDSAWTPLAIDLTAVAVGESAFRVRWGYHAGQEAYSGWNIDDVTFVTRLGGGLVSHVGGYRYGANNCAYGNTLFNRLNFDDASGAHDVDPQLLFPITWGKLLGPAMQNQGGSSFTLSPYTSTDFEGELRDASPDIGADEIAGPIGGLLEWYYCEVVPPIIGRMPAGALWVHLRMDSVFTPIQVFILPQGEISTNYDPADPSPRFIRLNVTAQAGGFWWGTNADPIETILMDDGDGFPSLGDAIADGHGAVFVWSESINDFVDPSGQAITGRNVTIDTIPPELTGSYPMPGDQVFFNTPTNLDITLQASYTDPVVRDATGVPLGPAMDEFLGLIDRQPSGFADVDDPDTALVETSLTGAPEDILYGPAALVPPGRWLSPAPAGSDILSSSDVLVTGDYALGVPNDSLSVDWNFVDAATGFAGIPWRLPVNNGYQYHMAIQFVATDLAGNRTEMDPTLIADPAHVWWMLKTDVEINPRPPKGAEVSVNQGDMFRWRLMRKQAPVPPTPEFRYRLWRSVYPGKLPESYGPYDGPYEAVSGWSWSMWSAGDRLPANFLEDVANDIKIEGYYVILTVQGADEAGNISPFPLELGWPPGDPGYPYEAADPGPMAVGMPMSLSWARFFVVGGEAQIDTTIAPHFWQENATGQRVQDFGNVNVVPLPPPESGILVGRMTIGYALREAVADDTEISIQWELDAPGLDGYTIRAETPTYVEFDFPSRLKEPVYCVFSARATLVLADETEIPDPTPATFSFTVTPSFSELVDPKDRSDHQSVVIRTYEDE